MTTGQQESAVVPPAQAPVSQPESAQQPAPGPQPTPPQQVAPTPQQQQQKRQCQQRSHALPESNRVALEERLRPASGDRDAFQLASARTTILYPVRAGEMARIGPEQVRERYGIEPKQVPDFIALRGDPSDKLPGAPGVGALGAATLLRRHGSLAGILKAGRFARIAEDLRLYRAIATMNKKAPLPSLASQKPAYAKATALARKWQLRQLAGRLEEMAKISSAA